MIILQMGKKAVAFEPEGCFPHYSSKPLAVFLNLFNLLVMFHQLPFRAVFSWPLLSQILKAAKFLGYFTTLFMLHRAERTKGQVCVFVRIYVLKS